MSDAVSDGGSERISQINGENLSIASTVMPAKIRDISRGKNKQAPEVFQKKFEEFEYLLDVFKKQIESDFDQDLIQKQQIEQIDLTQAKIAEQK